MSIPKEPRQILINLMYIVLTAMLALNVSAEILNAFLTMDDSINDSSAIVAGSNDRIINAIKQQADAYSQFKPFQEKATQAHAIAQEFNSYVSDLKEELIEASGGIGEDNLPVGKKNKDITTAMFVKEGRGEALEQKIKETRDQLIALIDDEEARAKLKNNIPLNVKPVPDNSDKENWAQFNFQQMPVAAVLPLLSKFQNDTKVAETSLLNYFLEKTGIEEMKPDAFEAVISADKSYVIRGEQLTAEIFLGAYSSTADNIEVYVDGRKYPVRNGKAIFTSNPSANGEEEFTALIKVTNPISGEVQEYRKKFVYEVGERSVTASAEKMNVFYIGVDNPLAIAAAGIPSDQMQVSAEGVELTKKSNGKYNVRPTRKGTAKITVSGGGLNPTTFDFRVKRIPDPAIVMSNKKGGPINAGEMRVQKGIIAMLEGFDFDARCNVVGFELTRVSKGNDPQVSVNRGGSFSSESKRIIERASAGDVYYFDKIKAKCPGDIASRNLNGMIFRIR